MGTKLTRDKYLERKAAKEAAAQKVLDKNREKADKSIDNINRVCIDLFVLGQILVNRIDSLNDNDCNYSQLALGKEAYMLKQDLKFTCNKFLNELQKTIDREKNLFDGEYLDHQDQILAIFETVTGEYSVGNIEKLHALSQVLVTNDPQPLVDYFKSIQNEN